MVGCSNTAVPETMDCPPTLPGSESLPTLTRDEWVAAQQRDPAIQRIVILKESGKLPTRTKRKTESSEVQRYLNEWQRLSFKSGVLYRSRITGDGNKVHQLVLPRQYRAMVLRGLHDDVGHLGKDRTLDLVRSRFFWPYMARDVETKIKSCERCVRRRMPQGARSVAPLVNIQTSQPMELVCMDYLTLEESKGGISNISGDHRSLHTLCSRNPNPEPDRTDYS
ncbi:uncharacterized protein [Ptychodera flava]|uniref:uncharacterized protein n=1 Tax=Ptychodera flava TaxID=63121 RepID=UPI00396A8DB1